MPAYSDLSQARLDTCDSRLQHLFNRIIQITDCTILEGYRPQLKQDRYFDQGLSKLRWPQSTHNKTPSRGIDVAPYPIPDWNNPRPFDHFAGLVRGVANEQGITIRWGGDWDGDFDLSDQSFNDLVHFEVLE